PVSGQAPFAVYISTARRLTGCQIISFYAYGREVNGELKDPVYVIRNWFAFADPESDRYADSRTCPAMLSALRDLNKIAAPKIAVPGLDEKLLFKDGLDGGDFRFWTNRGRFDTQEVDGRYTAEFTGWNDSPIGKWDEAEIERLRPCWTDMAPVIP